MAKAKPVKKVVRPLKSKAKSSRSSATPARKVVKLKPKSKSVGNSRAKSRPAGPAKARAATKSTTKTQAPPVVKAKLQPKKPSEPVSKPATGTQVKALPAPVETKPPARDASKAVKPPVASKVVPKPAAAAKTRSKPFVPQSIPIRPIQVAPPKVQPAAPVVSSPDPAAVVPEAQPKKGVRKATLTSGIREDETTRKLGRSRIPIDAPLEVVFQNDTQAREAFMFLGINSIRELENFTPDELVLRLTGPAKLTVGRIRKILAMNNRCLSGDEKFAMEFQELLNKPRE